MNNSQISHRINRLSKLMSLLDENSFKIKSFENAASIVAEHAEDMGVLVDEDRLKDIPGIGESLAYVIMYYAKAGTVGLEQELEAQLPEGLPELLGLPGLGVKKIRSLWKDHDITNIASLKQAAESNKLAQLKGFGPKLQTRLLDAIAFQEAHAKDFYLDTALAVAEKWLERLKSLKRVSSVSLTGKLRRRAELIQRVELLVAAVESELISDLNTQYDLAIHPAQPFVIKDSSGLPVEIWTCPAKSFAAHQLIRTGGEKYSEKLTDLFGSEPVAAIHEISQSNNSATSSEAVLSEALGIQWIEPELRDLYAEVPEALNLVRVEDLKGVFHAHTTWSDGRNCLEDLAKAAKNQGYQYLGVSEHSQAAYYANGLNPDRVKAQWELIDELNEADPDFKIFKGIEADILSDGRLDYTEELLAGFDFVIASIHSHFHLDSVQQTDRIVRALQSPFTTILGHPTGRMLMARPGYKPDLRTIIDVAAENDKFIEINTTPKRLDLDWRYLKYAREKGLKISIDPDAHSIKGLNSIPLGVSMARKGGYSPDQILNTMGREKMIEYLQKRRNA